MAALVRVTEFIEAGVVIIRQATIYLPLVAVLLKMQAVTGAIVI